jgi:hypothetical protein
LERGWPRAIFTKKGAILESGDRQAAQQALRNRVSEDIALSEKQIIISEFSTPGKACGDLCSMSVSPDLDQGVPIIVICIGGRDRTLPMP